MRFVADHIIHGIDAPGYEALYFDEPFNEALCRALRMRRQLRERREIEGVLTRRVAIAPVREIPRVLRPLLGGRQVAYTELVRYTWGSMAGDWTLEPEIFADRVSGRGTFRFMPDAAGCRRVVEGEVRIQVIGLGRLAERLVVDEVARSYGRAARFTCDFVAGAYTARP